MRIKIIIHGYNSLFTIHNSYNELVKLLVSKQADVNAEDEMGQSPMTIAIQSGKFALAEQLVIGKYEFISYETNASVS